MELLVRYAEALGAERFVDTNNVAGVPGSANPFLQNYYKGQGTSEQDAIFSFFDLDSDELIEAPQALVQTCCLQGGADPDHWETLGTKPEVFQIYKDREEFAAEPRRQDPQDVHAVRRRQHAGEGRALRVDGELRRSSTATRCSGARTNTEGRESTSAAMLTGKIPDWGFHRTDYRFGTHRIDVEVPVESVMDWGMLGYFVGDVVQEHIPMLTGRFGTPDLVRHKHFGAAAASSGGVELYHLVGVTPEARRSRRRAADRKAARDVHLRSGERRQTYDAINANASDTTVDYVMLGCPHAALEQIEEACRLLAGRTDQRQQRAVDLHVANRARAGRRARLLEDDRRRRRRADDRHLLGLRAGDSARARKSRRSTPRSRPTTCRRS